MQLVFFENIGKTLGYKFRIPKQYDISASLCDVGIFKEDFKFLIKGINCRPFKVVLIFLVFRIIFTSIFQKRKLFLIYFRASKVPWLWKILTLGSQINLPTRKQDVYNNCSVNSNVSFLLTSFFGTLNKALGFWSHKP